MLCTRVIYFITYTHNIHYTSEDKLPESVIFKIWTYAVSHYNIWKLTIFSSVLNPNHCRTVFNSLVCSLHNWHYRYVRRIIPYVNLIRCPIWLHPMLSNANPNFGLRLPDMFSEVCAKVISRGHIVWVFTFNQNWKANLEGYLTNHSMREASFDALLMGMPGSDLASPSVRSFWKWNGLFTSFHWKPINRSILFRIQLTGVFFLITGRGVLPMMGYTRRLRPKGVPFFGFRYMKG